MDLVALLRDEPRVRLHTAELSHLWLRTDAGLLAHSLSRMATDSQGALAASIVRAPNGTAGVLTMERVAGGVAVQAFRVLLEHAGADVRMDAGAEGRRLVAEIPH
jgi:hypothetical protein